ncbi:MAG TPA: hypothetical protein VN088_20615 [Nocardioides sp.]|nr:hypothetical protein [Nocardioides sp.]
MTPPMILTAIDPVTHEVGTYALRDVRVPRPYVGYDNATPVDHQHRSEACPDGRHLWDLLQTSGRYSPHEDDPGVVGHLDIRITGTCVRCGVIWRLEGTELDQSERGVGQLAPEPLRAGGLLAQEVDRDTWWREPRSRYTVHAGTDPAVIGHIVWGRTPRGRDFYGGRLNDWPDGHVVDAPSALACLRKLGRGVGAKESS